MKIAIFGTCVTRDTLEGRSHPFESITYFARSSWTSQVAPPWTGETEMGQLSSGFGERMVREDLGKLVLPRLAEARPDLLVIDLVDERFAVLDVDGTRVTVSDYLEQTPMAAALRERATRVVEPTSAERVEEFDKAARELAPAILDAVKDTPVVLHTAWWTSVVVDPSRPLYASAHRVAARHNAALAAYAQSLRDAFEGRLYLVQADPALIRSDPDHKWGPALYHYEPAYYDDVLRQLITIATGGAAPALPATTGPATGPATGPVVVPAGLSPQPPPQPPSQPLSQPPAVPAPGTPGAASRTGARRIARAVARRLRRRPRRG